MTNQEINDKNLELVKLIQNGDNNAEKELIELNKRMVFQNARRFYRSLGSTLDLEDLVQEGYIGLLEAAKRFDLSVDTTFMNYAYFWIVQKIQYAQLEQGYLLSYPHRVVSSYKRFKDMYLKYQDLSEEERNNKISKELGISLKEVQKYLDFQNSLTMYSFDMPYMSDDEGQEVLFIDILPDKTNIESIVMNKERRETIEAVLNDLFDGRTLDIIRNVYKFEKEPLNSKELAEKYNISPERVRQIKLKALHKLRYPKNSKKLKDFLDYSDEIER